MASEANGVSGLTGRYATALFELAEQNHALDQVAADLATLQSLVGQSADLRHVLRSPLIDRADAGKALAKLVEAASLSDIARKFVGVIARKGRLFVLPQIIEAFLALLAARRGEIKATVTAAQRLTDAQVTALTDELKRTVGPRVKVDIWIDPSLIGGMIIKVGSRMVDGSLRTKLQRLQFAMKGN